MGTNKRILMAVAGMAGVLLLSSCENVRQPKPGCTIGQGDYAAKYTPKPGQDLTTACAALKGERVNLRDYTDGDQDYISLRSENLGRLSLDKTRKDPNPENRVYSFGTYPKVSNEQNFCVSPSPSMARLQLPASGTSPAVDRSYEWKNVQILSTSRAAGTQLKAELKYTDAVAGCSIEFDVVAMWPAIDCGSPDPNDKTKRVPDNTKCATKADPERNIRVGCNPAGSCLSPDIKTSCDPQLLLCVLDGTPPVYADQ